MKKTLLFAALAVAAVLSSCDGVVPKAHLANGIDTLSYEIGLAYSGQAEGAMQQFQVDSAYTDEFVKGALDGVFADDDKKKQAYFMGVIFGMQSNMQLLQGMEREIFGTDTVLKLSRKNFVSAIAAALKNKSTLKVNDSIVSPEYAYELANARIMELRKEMLEKQYGKEKEAGAEFLAENAKKEGVKNLGDGVQYKVLKEGKGALPADTSVVSVRYEGRLINGNVFDSSARGDKNEPVDFPVGGVIKGFGAALKQMPVGSEWEIYIPYDMAYGEQGTPSGIPPFATLIFKVELVSIK